MPRLVIPTPKKLQGISGDISDGLGAIGLNRIISPKFVKRYDSDTIEVYNRAAIKDSFSFSGKSNFFVTLLYTGNTVRAWVSDPDQSAAAAKYGFDKYVHSFTFAGGLSNRFVTKLTKTAAALMANKPENQYRVDLHTHLGSMSGTPLNSGSTDPHKMMYDDGLSADHDMGLQAIISNLDAIGLSSHNSFRYREFVQFASEMQKFGISIIPGIEATLPLQEHELWLKGSDREKLRNPNGPHYGLYFKTPEEARDFYEAHLSDRSLYSYSPCASAGVELDTLLSQMKGKGATIANHIACDLGLPQVGLLDRLIYGEISVAEFKEKLLKSDGLEMFNIIVEDGIFDFKEIHAKVDRVNAEKYPHFDAVEMVRRHRNIMDAKEWLLSLFKKYQEEMGGTSVMSNKNLTKLVAIWAEKEGGLLRVVGADEHNFNELYTKLLAFWTVKKMGAFAKGWNTLALPAVPEKKPDASGIVSYMMNRKSSPFPEAKWSCNVFYELKNGIWQITDERSSDGTMINIWNGLKTLWIKITKQGNVLVDDARKAMLRGGPLTNELRGSLPLDSII